MENLLTLYDNFLLSLQNMNTNILVEYLNNYDIFNQLVLLRNNEENIKCYIKTNIYFSPLIFALLPSILFPPAPVSII